MQCNIIYYNMIWYNMRPFPSSSSNSSSSNNNSSSSNNNMIWYNIIWYNMRPFPKGVAGEVVRGSCPRRRLRQLFNVCMRSFRLFRLVFYFCSSWLNMIHRYVLLDVYRFVFLILVVFCRRLRELLLARHPRRFPEPCAASLYMI